MTIYILNLIRRHQTSRPGRVFAQQIRKGEKVAGHSEAMAACPRGAVTEGDWGLE